MTRRTAGIGALLLLAVNVILVWPLFAAEFLAYTFSIEATFIAVARVTSEHPFDWSWWPLWNGGMPFENVYLPLSHWFVTAFTLASGASPALSFHIVAAALYSLGAATFFLMALELSGRPVASFLAGLAYSCVSFSAILVPSITADAGGALHLRRYQDLVYWGEYPHAVALVFLPIAVLCFHRALRTYSTKWTILAGVLAAMVVLSNAFGAMALVLVLACWMLAFPARPWWKAPAWTAAIGVVSFCWVSPWLSPSMIRAIRANAATAGGDYRYTAATWIALGVLTAGYAALWLAMRRAKVRDYLQFFTLFAYISTALVVVWYAWGIAVLPQPSRYEQEMDFTLPLVALFWGALLVDRLPKKAGVAVGALAAALLAAQTVHAIAYAHGLTQTVNSRQLSEYKIAKWLDEHRPGDRAFVAGSTSLLFNAFTDNPQLRGGHEQHAVNPFIPTVAWTLTSDMNAGDRGADYSLFWLKAFGVQEIAVTGPGSTDAYQAYVHPHKFDRVLPVLWQDGADTIYGVPMRSDSLAHVIPAAAVPKRTPDHGLDLEPVQPYIDALDDPRYPPATFEWQGTSAARIQADLEPGQVVSVQITYERGWQAWAGGREQRVRGDAIGQLVIDTDCTGTCEITMRYTGGMERVATRSLSIAAMLAAIAFAWFNRRRSGKLL